MATSVDIKKELISSESIIYMRPLSLQISAVNLKPNTKMYAFFDGVDVNQYFTQNGKLKGEQLVTDLNGSLTATFDVPGLKFTTGEKELILSDYNIYNAEQVGAAVVKASSYFLANGTLQTYRTTENITITSTNTTNITNVREIFIPPPPPASTAFDFGGESADVGDPLSQSFFTYGVEGGCFITAIELYFFTKDTTIPVSVEIRELVNGYPGKRIIAPHARAFKQAADIFVSADASIPTKFVFSKLVYLEQDKDYCFVVYSNSNRYNLWLSELGEQSVETGRTIFEQPNNGSTFRSENNITWISNQTQDIKFTLYKAEFNTNTNPVLNLAVHPNILTLDSRSLNTFLGLNSVFITFPFKHGLDVNSVIGLSADTLGNYNGISGTALTGDHDITEVVDEFTVGIKIASASATKTGEVSSNGAITAAVVTNGGSNYSSTNPPLVVITGTGTGAAIKPIITNGKITDLVVTNQGSGYSQTTTITFDSSGTSGSGASAQPVYSNRLYAYINRPYQEIQPNVSGFTPPGTIISGKLLSSTLGSYEGGSLSSYSPGPSNIDIELNKMNNIGTNLLCASRLNENELLGGGYSTNVQVTLASSNKNVSPVFDIDKSSFVLRNNSINNQKNEDILSTNSSGSLLSVTVTQGGSGFTGTPTIEIVGTGTGATATAVMSGGAIQSITVVTGGSGYYGDVKVVAVGGGGSGAVLTPVMSKYNSELKNNYGRSLARYITKPLSVQEVSNGIRCYVTAYSNSSSGFDVYIKTNNSTTNVTMDDKEWTLLSCNVQRNRSNKKDQFLDYEFYIDDVEPFDVYQLKFVLNTTSPWDPPKINNFRAIVTA